MRIPFGEIALWRGSRELADTGWSSDTGLDFKVRPVARVVMEQVDEDTVNMEGSIAAICLSSCSRCGKDMEYKLDTSFDYVFRVGHDESLQLRETECSDDSCQTIYIEEKEIDIDAVLREQLILSVPCKLLCQEDCKGLCHSCGTQLNKTVCGCSHDISNSPFAVLKKLKK